MAVIFPDFISFQLIHATKLLHGTPSEKQTNQNLAVSLSVCFMRNRRTACRRRIPPKPTEHGRCEMPQG